MATTRARQKRYPSSIFDAYVGNRIRLARMAAGETQVMLASRWGISFQQVQKYETGFNKLSMQKAYEFSQFYNLPISYLTEGFVAAT